MARHQLHDLIDYIALHYFPRCKWSAD